jgi:hypothetical protein
MIRIFFLFLLLICGCQKKVEQKPLYRIKIAFSNGNFIDKKVVYFAEDSSMLKIKYLNDSGKIIKRSYNLDKCSYSVFVLAR